MIETYILSYIYFKSLLNYIYFKLHKLYITYIKNRKQNNERVKIDILLSQINFVLCGKKEYKNILSNPSTIIMTGYVDKSCDEVKYCNELCCIQNNTIYVMLEKGKIKDNMYICCINYFVKKHRIKYPENISYFSTKLNNLFLK